MVNFEINICGIQCLWKSKSNAPNGGTYFLNFGQIILMENLSTFHSYSNTVFEKARSVSSQGRRTRGNIQRPDYILVVFLSQLRYVIAKNLLSRNTTVLHFSVRARLRLNCNAMLHQTFIYFCLNEAKRHCLSHCTQLLDNVE